MFAFLIVILYHSWLSCAASPIVVSVPAAPSSSHVVSSNFFGISFELSFMDQYFGKDSSSIPTPMLNYMEQLRSRTGSRPVRVRVGGNSADSSNYVPSQGAPMVQLTQSANADNQPVNYGPELWKVMQKVSQNVGGVEYLIGLSLNDTGGKDALIAGGAQGILGDNLDAMMIGNEPDLYTAHGQRPNLKNYTVQDYIGEFSAVRDHLKDTSAGNLVSKHTLAGPTICCQWDLATLLQQGFLSSLGDVLKYITLQHYPQNNCFGTHPFGVPYYIQHANVVDLASWQKPGIDIIASQSGGTNPQMVMSEFNTASCGGIPGISDTFAASLWAVDYTLQLASIGYTAAYIHTRERGISYNLVTPPDDPTNGPWTTNPPFYSLVATAEILQSENDVKIADLNIEGSKTNKNVTVAGYAIYDSTTSSVIKTVLFNFGNSSTQFSLPSTLGNGVTVKFLSAPSATENQTISWGGETYFGAKDGKFVAAPDGSNWAKPNQKVDCSNGCTLDVPGTTMAVMFQNGADTNVGVSTNASTTSSPSASTTADSKSQGIANPSGAIANQQVWSNMPLLVFGLVLAVILAL